MKLRSILNLTAVLAVAVSAQQSLYANKPVDEKWVEDILSKMTLEEKVAMVHAQSKFSSPGVARLGIPEIWCDDGPHGVRPETLWDAWTAADWTNDSCTAYPSLTCLAATWDREMSALYGKSVGEEARYRNKTVLLGPGVNMCRTPLCGRNFEYMGEDPFLAGEMCVPYIKGVQSNGVATSVKHYCLNNQEFKRHRINVKVDDRTLYEIYLPAFEKAVREGGAWTVMGSYNLYKGQYCCHNDITVNRILKGEWGFDGVLLSDWGGTENTDQAASYGLDIEYGTHTNGVDKSVKNAYGSYYLATPYLEKLRKGELPVKDLDEKCRRILRLELRTNMDRTRPFGSMNSPEHWSDARKIGAAGIVLLKNINSVLPMKQSPKKVVVLGENAIKPMSVGGSSSSLKAQHEISPLDGLRKALPNTEVVYERTYQGAPTIKGYNYNNYDLTDARSDEQLLADALKVVGDADYVIFVGGLNKSKTQDCEGKDRLEYHLPYNQDAIVEKIASVRPDMIFVNVSGSPVAMPWAKKVSAIVQAWYLGSETGNALADVLTGAVCPSGKLPFTFPVEIADCPIKTQQQYPGVEVGKNMWEQEYSEGIFIGYRWYEHKKIKPQFAFGYGLSYTTFKYGDAKISSPVFDGNTLTVSVPVTNSGKVAGAEVVQLYIADKKASVLRPVKELKGFAKLFLEPGQTKTAEISFDRRALSFFDEKTHSWVAEPGDFEALIGSASNDIRTSIKFKLK